MQPGLLITLLLASSLVASVIAGLVAPSKRRHPGYWTIACFLFPPAIILLFLLSVDDKKKVPINRYAYKDIASIEPEIVSIFDVRERSVASSQPSIMQDFSRLFEDGSILGYAVIIGTMLLFLLLRLLYNLFGGESFPIDIEQTIFAFAAGALVLAAQQYLTFIRISRRYFGSDAAEAKEILEFIFEQSKKNGNPPSGKQLYSRENDASTSELTRFLYPEKGQ